MRPIKLVLVGTLVLALVDTPTVLVSAQDEAVTSSSGEGTELVPGLSFVTQEIEPGVHRVLSDGVRELSWPVELGPFAENHPPGALYRGSANTTVGITASEAGVWLRRPEGIRRLGEADPAWAPEGGEETSEFTVTSDGMLHRSLPPQVLREGTWQEVKTPRRFGLRKMLGFIVAPDGTIWATGYRGLGDGERRWQLIRRDGDGWSRVAWAPGDSTTRPTQLSHASAGPGGLLYLRSGEKVLRFDGERWTNFGRTEEPIRDLMVAPDGTVWVETSGPDGGWDTRLFLRADGDGWVRHETGYQPLQGLADSVVGTDGALWYTATGDPLANGGCDGVVRTDGTTTSRFLDDRCVHDLAVGPEGTVWGTATWWFGNYFSPESVSPVEVFAITPEAWSAAE